MKLLFTGTIPAAWLLAIFAAAATLTIMLYRRHRLPGPWNIWLPAIRVTVLALLILSLFRPVVARFHGTVQRGHIPILVDTSGSMSLVDTNTPSRQVEIACDMGLFPAKLRNTLFEKQGQTNTPAARLAGELRTDILRLRSELEANRPWTKEFSRQVDDLAGRVKAFGGEIDSHRDDLEKSVRATAYLSLSDVKPPATNRPERVVQFLKDFDGLVAPLGRMTGELKAAAESIRRTSDAEVKDPQQLTGLAGQCDKVLFQWKGLQPRYRPLQRAADECLAFAGIPEVDAGLAKLKTMKRIDLVKYLLNREPYRLLDRLGERGIVNVFTFRDTPEPVQPADYPAVEAGLVSTKIGSTICNVLQQYEKRPLAGLVLLSDGNNNAGKALSVAEEAVRERDIPLFVLGVGSVEPPPDVALARVIAPRTSFVDDRLNISVVMKRHGYLDRPIRLKVTSGQEVLREKTVNPGAQAGLVVDMSFVEKEGGTRDYAVETETFSGEAFTNNNRETFSVSILKDRIRTLLIDEYPRWESRYIGMMLSRDKRVDLRTIFVASTKDNALPAGKDGYPENVDALFAYDIVIMGDVNPRHFTTQQMRDIRAFVLERGGTIIFVAGEHSMPARYAGTPVEELVPLRKYGRPGQDIRGDSRGRGAPAAGAAAEGEGGETPGFAHVLRVPKYAVYEDILQIGGTPEDSQELWENLPRLGWIREDVEAAPAADVLVRGRDARDTGDGEATPREPGDLDVGMDGPPVMIKSYVGSGKTLYLGADSFWRWRYQARWKYHHRFWGQVLLWATMGRTTGADKYVKLMTDRLTFAPEEPVSVSARILGEDGVPVNRADAALEVYDGEKKLVKTVPLIHLDRSGGEYRAQLRDLPRGKYRLVPRVEELKGREVHAELNVEVRDLPTGEYVELGLNEGLLRKLGTRYLSFEKAQEIVESVPRVDIREEHRTDTEVWDTLPFMILVAALLGLEWQIRKRLKMV